MLKVGAKFGSFAELEPLLEKFAEQQCVPYGIYCSLKVEKFFENSGHQLPPELTYQSFTYACKHYGSRREKGLGIRPNQSSFKMKCPSRIRVCADLDCNKLVVKAITSEHNHICDPDLAPLYPEGRQLTSSEAESVMNLVNMEVKPALLQSIVRTSTQKFTTLQDLRNLSRRMTKGNDKASSTNNNASDVERMLEELEDMKKNDPNSKLCIAEKDGKILYIFWASSQMQADYRQYPEVVGMDNTYNDNNSKMPLGIFMCHDRNGHGKVVAYILLQSEKKEILHAAFSEFSACYSSDIHRTKTVFVDKSMNEIFRIREVMPNVAIILCRFHCVNIFNENTTAEQAKEKLRKYLKGMLFCETQNEYNAYYFKVCQVASDSFRKYFDNNWHSSAVCFWKGYERLDFVTKGVTTTNHNESWHGKLKTLLNRKRTIADMFSKLRIFHENSINASLYLEFTNVAKVHYVLNNSDQIVAEITRTSTPYVSSMIRKQYELSLKIDALPANYALDSQKCVCTFFKSYTFPCVHIFFSRRMQDVPLFSIDDIESKWRVVAAQLNENSVANANEELMEDLEADNLERPLPVFKPPNPLKLGGRKLNSRERYTDFLNVCERAGGVASVTGGKQFLERRQVIEDIVSMWENNQEVAVMPLARGAVSVHHSVTAEQSTVTASDAGSAGPVVSPTRPSVIVPHPEIVTTAKPTVNCRCGLEALRFVAKYGANRGRVCYRCPKTLPQVPCLFKMVESSNHQDSSEYSSDTRKGITVHNVGVNVENRPSLSLPPKIVVKGQPKAGHQRTFKKKQKKDKVKEWSDCEENRKASADTIKDADVKQLSETLWEIKSQSGPDLYIVQVMDIGSSCQCHALCTHCYECDCMDFTIRRYPCKHIHKVFSFRNHEQPFTGNEDSLLNGSYDDVKPLKAQLAVEDGLTITLSDSENELENTAFMEEGSCNDVKPLIAQSAVEDGLIIDLINSESETEEAFTQSEQPILLCHICNKTSAEQIRCIDCQELMHGTLPCSLDNMCNHCCDYSFEEYYGYFRVAGQKKKGPPYFCFGCDLIMRLHIAKNPKSPSRKGDFYYSCDRKKTQKCDLMFWAPKGLKDIPSPQSTGLTGQVVQRCCSCSMEAGQHTCVTCHKVVHAIFPCSTSGTQEQDRVCRSCSSATSKKAPVKRLLFSSQPANNGTPRKVSRAGRLLKKKKTFTP